MKRKLLLLISALLLLSLLFVACGGEEEAVEEVIEEEATEEEAVEEFVGYDLRQVDREIEISLWQTHSKEVSETINQLVADFETEHPMITVNTTNVGPDELRRRVQGEFLTGGGPDVVQASFRELEPFSRLRMITPIEEKISEEMSNLYLDNALTAMSLDDNLYGIPETLGNQLVLLYNRDYVESSPQNWTELIALAQEFNDPSQDRYGLAYDLTDPVIWVALQRRLNGSIFDEDYNPTLDTQASRDTMELIERLKFSEDIVPQDINQREAKDIFTSGDAVFSIVGDWQISDYKNNTDIDLGVATLPVKEDSGAEIESLTTGSGYMLMEDLSRREEIAVLKFMRFMTNSGSQERLLTEHGILPTNKELYETDMVLQEEVFQNAAEQLINYRPKLVEDEFEGVLAAIEAVLVEVASGDIDSSEAPALMQQRAEEAL